MTSSVALIGLALLALVARERPTLLARALAPGMGAEIRWVHVPAGKYTPVFPPSDGRAEVVVPAFEIATTPVTNGDFLRFVEARPNWSRDRVSRLFADAGYLSHWSGPDAVGDAGMRRPVTRVSWFAASAYCEAAGGRLPSEAEWGRIVAENPASDQLAWYARPSHGPEADVGATTPNRLGVRDTSGLVWEWVLDFNANLVTADSRNPAAGDKNTFCGTGALTARDPDNYAAFMRVAFMSSLEARFVARHLGFRCARDISEDDS